MPFGVPDIFAYQPSPKVTDAKLIDLVKSSGSLIGGLIGGNEEIVFTYMPDNFSESKQAIYAQTNILGRSEPIYGYAGSSSRVFTLNFNLVADGTSGNTFNEILQPIWLIRSWVYPDYKGLTPNIPPRVLFVVGKWLSQRCVVVSYNITYSAPWTRMAKVRAEDFIDGLPPGISGALPGLIKDDPFLYGQLGTPGAIGSIVGGNPTDIFNTINGDGMIPFMASVSLQLHEVAESTEYSPYDHWDVVQGGDRSPGQYGLS